MVQQVQQPIISLEGTKTITTTPDDLRMGQKVFRDLFITADVSAEEEEPEDEEEDNMNETNSIDTKVQKIAYKVSQTLMNRKLYSFHLVDTNWCCFCMQDRIFLISSFNFM